MRRNDSDDVSTSILGTTPTKKSSRQGIIVPTTGQLTPPLLLDLPILRTDGWSLLETWCSILKPDPLQGMLVIVSA